MLRPERLGPGKGTHLSLVPLLDPPLQATAKGSHGAFPEKGSRLWEPGEGGGLLGQPDSGGAHLRGAVTRAGAALAGAPGKKVQEALPARCDSDTLTLPTPSASSLRSCPASPGFTQDAGAEDRSQVRVQVPPQCCVTPASSWAFLASLNGVKHTLAGSSHIRDKDSCQGTPGLLLTPFDPLVPSLSLLWEPKFSPAWVRPPQLRYNPAKGSLHQGARIFRV